MGLLDDAIREHLELKRRHGAAASEVERLTDEVFGSAGATAAPERAEATGEQPRARAAEPETEVEPEPTAMEHPLPSSDAAPELAPETEVAPLAEPDPDPAPPAIEEAPLPVVEVPKFTDAEPWLDEPDEVPSQESLDHATQEHQAVPDTGDYVAPDEDAEGEDVLEETPEFLQETPEHDRLWFEQKPPRDFDLGN